MHGKRWFFRPVRNHKDAGEDAGEPTGRPEREGSEDSAGPQKEINWHEIIWEKFFPIAFSIGISEKEFRHLNPRKLEYCIKGYELKERRRDEEAWMWWGVYGYTALASAIERNFSKHPKAKYIEKPILQRETEESEEVEANSESREECAVYEMKQRINLLRQQGLPESPD